MTALTNKALEWCDRVKAAWAHSAEAIIETGKLLTEAKKQLAHGEWLPMLEHVGFPRRKAQRLMELAADERFANALVLTLLPDEWTSVHALHKIDCDVPQLIEYIHNPHLLKQEKRAAKEFLLGAKQQALPQQKFGVVYADPEWRFEPWSRETGLDRAADNHYPTSATEVIASRDVASICADDCVLFLWATAPMLPQALLVMGTWGFDYRSQFVWVKDRIGTGYWTRNQHELLLIGVRGKPPAPAPGTRESSVIMAPVTEHSVKPEIVLEYIEGWYPTLPKIELNRRGPARKGWSAWGLEAEGDASPVPVASPEPAPLAARSGAGSPPPSEAA
jgi:N6-adenosine-specific RNA methylase IME4